MADQKQVIETLCKLTTTGDEVDRCYAVRTLGILRDTLATPNLIQCLRDEDIDVCIDAAEALGQIGDTAAIVALKDSLQYDPNGEVKTAVVEALGKIGGTDVTAPLLEIAKSCPKDIVWDDANEWNDWWDMQFKAVEALGKMRTTDAVPVLKAMLADEETQDIESEVLTALARIGGEGETILIQCLTGGTPKERRRAAMALGLSKGTEARKALARAMMDKDSYVRVAAINALGKLGAEPYIDIMLQFLKDSDPLMRRAVVEVTKNFSGNSDNAEMMRDKLALLLTDSSPVVRVAALNALSDNEHLSPEILAQIRQRLNDQDDTVIAATCTLLAQLGDNTILPTLLQILSDQERDAGLRSTVAAALGILGNLEAVGILSWAMKNEVQSVRLAALNALMQLEKSAISSSSPLKVIIAALKGNGAGIIKDKKERIKDKKDTVESATKQSAEIVTPKPVETSVAVKSENDGSTQRSAMSTLEAIAMDNAKATLSMDEQSDTTELSPDSEKLSAEVQEYLDIAQENIDLGERVRKKVDVAADVRYLSARMLGDSDSVEAVKALISVLNDDDMILRREAANSLGLIASRSPHITELTNAFGSLVTHLNIRDNELRLTCARTLGALGNEAAIPVLFPLMLDENGNVRAQTIQSLTTLILTNSDLLDAVEVDKIIAQFMELLHDKSAIVRQAAAEALATLRCPSALDAIIEAAFADAGAQARDMGRALRRLDIAQSATNLLKKLESVPDSSHRRFVIYMLEELFV
jgi:HEAT repeat protein